MQPHGEIQVVEPGLLTTVQDLGRPGNMRHGVSPGGALDRRALVLGNLLCGNDPRAAGIEITLVGPRLRFGAPGVIAISGADLGARLDGTPLPRWQPVAVRAGSELLFDQGHRGAGARAYLCVAGGIAVPPVLGSRSTDLAARFGGVEGRALRAGDRLAWGRPPGSTAAVLTRRLIAIPSDQDDSPIRVVLGPQRERFTKKGIAAFLDGPYIVSAQGDRMGVRLIDGPPIAHRRGADLISEGIVPGSIQVPGDGQPIALLAACQTMGGYPKIATVIGADLDRLAQLRPGERVRFAAIDVAAARAATIAYRAALGEHAIRNGSTVEEVAPLSSSSLSPAENRADAAISGLDAWTPDGVIRVIAALRDAGLEHCQIDLSDGQRRLSFSLGSGYDARSAASPRELAPRARAHEGEPSAPTQNRLGNGATITAPMLGVFYRRPTPDDAPFAAPGDAISAGQVIGLIEVMKTFNEVTCPRDGILGDFLVEDGAFVEYGQAIARLR